MEIKRHKVFISYHHADQKYKDDIVEWLYFNYEKNKLDHIFDDYSVGDGDIDDEKLSAEQIRKIIRDDYINEAKVLVLLCGRETKKRKHIDWELQAAMYHSEDKPRLGIVVVNLPTISQGCNSSDINERKLISSNKVWIQLKNRCEFEDVFPFMPSRIIDNLEKNVPISVVNWSRVKDNPEILMELIDNAYNRKKIIKYINSSPLRKHNS